MRSKVVASGLAIVLGLTGVGSIGFPESAIAQTVDEKKRGADRLFNQGNELFRVSQFEGAFQSWQSALNLYREVKDRPGEVAALGNLGNAYIRLGDYTKAIECHEKSLSITREIKDRLGEGKSLGSLGNTYYFLGKYARAVEYLKQSLDIAREIKDRRSEGAALGNLGSAYYALGNYAKAIEYSEQHLVMTREIKHRIGEANALRNLGSAYYALGNYSKAIEYYEQSLTIAREIKDRLGEGQSLGNLGSSYFFLGNYSKAIEYHEQNLAIAREIKDRLGEGESLGYLGPVYYALGNYVKAIEYQELSLAIAREIKNRSGESDALGNLGNAYYALGNYPKAIEYHEQHLAIAREIKGRQGEGHALGNLGLTYAALGNYPKAINYYEQSLAIAREIKDRPAEGSASGNLGNAYNALGNYPKAIEFHEQYLAIAREIKDRNGEYITLNNLAATLAKKEPELAIVFYKQSINVAESIRKDLRQLSREAQEIYTSTVAKSYRNLANLLLTQGRTHEAQLILELLKVQEAQTYDSQQQASIEFPLHTLETQALQAFEKSIASKQTLNQETLNPIGQPLTQNRDRITQDMNAIPIAIGNPQAVLKANPNALLIQNLVVNDKLWVLWTNASGNTKAIVVPNVTQKQLDETVKTFRGQIGDPRSNLNALKATSTQLYNWLIPAELQAELKNNPKQQLLFSLDHVTRYIPIAALYDGKDYLAQRYTLSNLITVDIDVRDRLSSNGSAPTILGLGTTKPYKGFSALPNVEAELKAIVKDNTELGIYPGKIQLNNAFTATSLSQNLDAYRVLHIATHGSFNPKSITASFLLLGNGDRLPITDIAALTNLKNTHLVVLSACETGLSGAGQDGTEISGIGGYFLRRGAKSVLASLWSVNDASTALLMQQFYKNLSQTKLTKAEALQKVQQDFISGKFTTKEATNIRAVRPHIEGQLPPDSFAHPYFWAPFTLTGNPN